MVVGNSDFSFSLIIFIYLTNNVLSQADYFSREHALVVFDPYVSITDAGIPDTYNESELSPLLEKVWTRFGKIVLQPNRGYYATKEGSTFSTALVPQAAAKFNLRNTLNDPQSEILEVWMTILISISDNLNKTLENIERTRTLMDQANSIFPRTVTHLLLDYLSHTKLTDDDSASIEVNLLETLKVFASSSQYNYKFGILLPVNLCIYNPHHVLPYVDVISYQFGPKERVLDGNIPIYFREGIQLLNNCKNRDLAIINMNATQQDIKYIPFTYWPDTGNFGAGSVKNLVQYWNEANAWAERTNSLVIFRRSFDTPFSWQNIYDSTHGWWRLIENSSYRSTKDYIFEEKKDLVGWSPQLKDLSFLQRPLTFSRRNIGVSVEPYVSELNVGQGVTYSEEEINTLLKQVSTNFTKLLMMPTIDDSTKLIPLTTARFNREQRITNRRFELTMIFTNTNFDLVKSLADAANDEFPGTVTSLVYWNRDQWTKQFDFEKYTTALVQFYKNHVEVPLSSNRRSSFKYNFGVLLPSGSCDGIIDSWYTEKYLGPLLNLPYLDILYFSHLYLGDRSRVTVLGPERVLLRIKTLFEVCQRKLHTLLQRESRKMRVEFMTGWPDTDNAGRQNEAHFVKFWSEMSEWAVRSNATLYFRSAFDLTPFQHAGWWKMTRERGNATGVGENVQVFRFEDKKSIALRKDVHHLKNPKYGQTAPRQYVLGTGEIVAIVVSTIAVTAFLSGFIFLVLLRRKRLKDGLLSSEEINEFFKGEKRMPGSSEQTNASYQKRPYDTVKYELVGKSYTIDTDSVLGAGEFGIVCRGTVKRDDLNTEPVPVAVKMIKKPCSSATLKGMLSEIKILSYVGAHRNLVSLVGAYTSGMRKGQVYAFLELCDLGSLKNYLSSIKPQIISSEYENEEETRREILEPSNLSDMFRWSCEIANGLEFLASHQVVHADVATRNVLLTSDKTAKISDFGLSRRLYDYTNYVKTQQEPLPWRWMSPEALRKLEFSEKSDVWAYGVTLWEIYTLGEEAYPGLSWDINFPRQLERGLRLSEPRFNDRSMFYTTFVHRSLIHTVMGPIMVNITFEISRDLGGEAALQMFLVLDNAALLASRPRQPTDFYEVVMQFGEKQRRKR